MAADLSALTADLVAETAWLDEVLGALSPAQWRLRTPAPGWTIGSGFSAHRALSRCSTPTSESALPSKQSSKSGR